MRAEVANMTGWVIVDGLIKLQLFQLQQEKAA